MNRHGPPWIVLLVVALCGLRLASADGSDPWHSTIAERVRDGMLLNHAGRYDAADEVWAQLLKGQLALAPGRTDEAFAELEVVLAMDGISRAVRRRASREIDRIRNE